MEVIQIMKYFRSVQGIISYADSVWTKDIKTYETNAFGQDTDGDSAMLNLSQKYTDTNDIELYKNPNDPNNPNDDVFYIKDGSKYIPITEEWGDFAYLQYSWGEGSNSSSSIPIAVENEGGTDRNSDGDSNGYYIAIKHTGIYSSESYTDWQIMYTDSKGVIDYSYMPWMQSIKSEEEIFGQDLENDYSTTSGIG